jgi:hypothetical protein
VSEERNVAEEWPPGYEEAAQTGRLSVECAKRRRLSFKSSAKTDLGHDVQQAAHNQPSGAGIVPPQLEIKRVFCR